MPRRSAVFLSTLLFTGLAASVTLPGASLAQGPKTPAQAQPQPQPEAKLTLIGLETGVTAVAQFNPKEITLEKAVPWTKSPTSTGDQPELQFTSATGRVMSFELTFDTYESRQDVHTTYLSRLFALASVMEPSGPEDKRRPPRVKVVWGASGLVFEGVIEQLSTRYTAFLPTGVPVRATCSIKLREASRVSYRR